MALCFVSIGSNVDRERNVRGALQALHTHFGPLLVSSVYETAAVGFEGEPFYNLVAGFVTADAPQRVAAILRAIETDHGRIRGEARFAPRTLDIDLLLHGNSTMQEPGLELPRPEIGQYAFVLGPLAEIAPDLEHPVSGETYRTAWLRMQKDAQVLRAVALGL